MIRCIFVLSACLLATALMAQETPTPDTPAVKPAMLQSVEDKYSAESAKADALITKAETEATKLRKAAAEVRLKAYKERLVEVTKSGDFDKAVAVKARIVQLEKDRETTTEKPEKTTAEKLEKTTKRPKPKDTVKFEGHTYALINEKVTWHIAKQLCEEMGGHLVTMDSNDEQTFVATLCASTTAWVGASDEHQEGNWVWVNGSSVPKTQTASWIIDNENNFEHHLFYYPAKHNFMDGAPSTRFAYVCEWSK